MKNTPMSRPAPRQDNQNYGFVIRTVMKLSGGAISNERQASIVLVFVALLFFAGTGFVIWKTVFSQTQVPRPQGGKILPFGPGTRVNQ